MIFARRISSTQTTFEPSAPGPTVNQALPLISRPLFTTSQTPFGAGGSKRVTVITSSKVKTPMPVRPTKTSPSAGLPSSPCLTIMRVNGTQSPCALQLVRTRQASAGGKGVVISTVSFIALKHLTAFGLLLFHQAKREDLNRSADKARTSGLSAARLPELQPSLFSAGQ